MGLTIMKKAEKQLETAAIELKTTAGIWQAAKDLDGICDVKATPDETKMFVGDEQIGTIAIGMAGWNKLIEGSMTSKAAKSLIKNEFKKGVLEAHGVAVAKKMFIYEGTDEDGGEVTASYEAEDSICTVAELSDTPVPLSEATKLRQPVKGSDSKSVYFCIALGEGINMAVRVKANHRVSIRCEGEDIADYSQVLKEAGLGKAGDQHWSLHLDAQNKALVRKTVGSLLFATGISWKAIMPDVAQLIGEGV